jgi:hypothetical protein
MAGDSAPSSSAPPQQPQRRATGAELLGMSKYLGVRCNSEEVAFMACKERYNHPEDCLEEAKAVLKCSQHLLSLLGFFVAVGFSGGGAAGFPPQPPPPMLFPPCPPIPPPPPPPAPTYQKQPR